MSEIYILGDRVQQARVKNALTQEELAEKINKSVITIFNIENEKKGATIGTLVDLCSVLDVTPNFLLEFDD